MTNQPIPESDFQLDEKDLEPVEQSGPVTLGGKIKEEWKELKKILTTPKWSNIFKSAFIAISGIFMGLGSLFLIDLITKNLTFQLAPSVVEPFICLTLLYVNVQTAVAVLLIYVFPTKNLEISDATSDIRTRNVCLAATCILLPFLSLLLSVYIGGQIYKAHHTKSNFDKSLPIFIPLTQLFWSVSALFGALGRIVSSNQ